jgi:hypothetical protein
MFTFGAHVCWKQQQTFDHLESKNESLSHFYHCHFVGVHMMASEHRAYQIGLVFTTSFMFTFHHSVHASAMQYCGRLRFPMGTCDFWIPAPP